MGVPAQFTFLGYLKGGLNLEPPLSHPLLMVQYVGILIETIVWNFYEVFADGNLCVGLLVAGAYMVPLAYDNGIGPRYWDWRFRH